MKFVKRPVVIDARRTTAEEFIQTLEGVMRAAPGDWVITGLHGEEYPCKPDVFEKSYAPVDDEARGAWAEVYGAPSERP